MNEHSPNPMPTRPDPCRLSTASVVVKLTSHAVDRYRERVRPGLDVQHARIDLERLLSLGEITSWAPCWLQPRQHQAAAFYLTVGDISLPLDPNREDRERLVALTCLVRGSLSDCARLSRNQRRSRRTACTN
jgi:hypothetical protein